ncbi:MAG: Zn-ribbon domain-containing protein [Halanaeroarchaeum sp.]
MPHQCANCGKSFPDGSKEMLSGCPDCGGNKFQYLPNDALTDDSPPADPPDRGADSGLTDAVGQTATTVRDYVANRSGGDETSPDPSEREAASTTDDPDTAASHPTASSDADDGSTTEENGEEDAAQASARGDVVDRNELPDETRSVGSAPPSEGRVVKEPTDEDSLDRPELEELREELNDQFESIRIVAPGQYELNLMELYDREEHIIALQEDGRYIIEVPDTWRDEGEE